ncbi:anthocyanidin 3-O-glucosyltransferase 1-like [Coffea eugenioides]|uniref:anthocyanidin 3-O-glucosyltransferase 1-like n=1 Tax=Coffea eugenioides TaxID=49369 RepID=UPI000F6045C6|nr:anthocyanidin 3-O-glucosyltransferase 1-like [Coffea eugenioides]
MVGEWSLLEDVSEWKPRLEPKKVIFGNIKVKSTMLDRIKEGQMKQPTVQKWVERVKKGELPDFNLNPDEILKFRNCVVVPKDEELKREILEESHRSRYTIYPGSGKMIDKVIKWAPQAPILAHPAVQGFVTHCSWNLVLESVSFEVPVAMWPMYAEQQINAFLIVKDLGIAAEIKMDYNNDIMNENDVIVKSNEIEDGIRQLMQPDSEIRRKVKDLMEKIVVSNNLQSHGNFDIKNILSKDHSPYSSFCLILDPKM